MPHSVVEEPNGRNQYKSKKLNQKQTNKGMWKKTNSCLVFN
jgi:hypothetical protein